jgi:dihydroorotase
MKYLLFFLFSLLVGVAVNGQPTRNYDIVLEGGRVMDPETGFDGIRNVGIIGDRIMEISVETLDGMEVIDASGLVVAPGFIDLHVHGMTNEAHEYQARDGVTTALELESGVTFVKEWIEQKKKSRACG